jgi:hypothetical protein
MIDSTCSHLHVTGRLWALRYDETQRRVVENGDRLKARAVRQRRLPLDGRGLL